MMFFIFFVRFSFVCFRFDLSINSNSMCCAQTAAPKKEKYSHSECKNDRYCIKKKALGNKAQGAAKTIGKRSPGTRQNPLK